MPTTTATGDFHLPMLVGLVRRALADDPRLGGQAVSLEIDQPGFSSAGYVNISTSDHVIHGQVKQASGFSFVRIYNAG